MAESRGGFCLRLVSRRDGLGGQVAHDLDRLARDRLGDTPLLRIGKAPKRMLVYRAEQPFSGMNRAPLEVLGRGRQFVAFAVHPDTGKPYEWPEESPLEVAFESLPAITEDAVRAWLNAAAEILQPGTLSAKQGHGHNSEFRTSSALAGTFEAVREALAFIPNADLDYNNWMRVGMAIKGALGDQGKTLFSAWSAQSVKNAPDFTAKSWTSFHPSKIGAGTLYQSANAAGWKPAPSLVLDGSAPQGEPHPAAPFLARLEASPASPAAFARPKVELLDIAPPGGVLGDMVSYMLATARRPQPELALGASLCALGALMGRKYRTETNLRSNLYIIGIGGSGSGKNHPREVVNELLVAAGLGRYLGGNKIASGAGLLGALHRQPALLMQIDEFGMFLQSAG